MTDRAFPETPEELLQLGRETQHAFLKGAQAWSEQLAKNAPQLSGLPVSELVTHPTESAERVLQVSEEVTDRVRGAVPSASELSEQWLETIEQGFEFLEQTVRTQRELTRELLKALPKAAETDQG